MDKHSAMARLIGLRREHEVSLFDMPLKELVNKDVYVGGKCIRHDVIVSLIAVVCYMRPA